jgi:tyrosinase
VAVVRRNILNSPEARRGYVRGVKLLKEDFAGPTTAGLGVPGPPQPVSTYDLFVVWHHVTMMTFTPPGQIERNAAHGGPVFLPWHRFMLILFELQLQRVLGDQEFGLPYWDWAADGERSPEQQPASPLWAADCMGGQGDPVASGPFAFDPADPQRWRVRIEASAGLQLRQVDRGLRRGFGAQPGVRGLPDRGQVGRALALTRYDASPWNTQSSGFRNRLEGWRPASGPGLHNRVHVWVGGDMLRSTSPNDPVFFLNHCNVDRAWAAWLSQRGQLYRPPQSAAASLLGHRIDDQIRSLVVDRTVTPREMLDASELYAYDSLAVA